MPDDSSDITAGRVRGNLSLPDNSRSPWWELSRRLLLAIAILVGTVLIVYFDRHAYRDSNDPPYFGVDLVDSIYYSTVTLSTTGYGDIAPVAAARPADQRLHHHPAPHRLPGAVDRDHPGGARLAGSRDAPHRPLEEENGSPRRRDRLRHQGPRGRRHPGQQRPGPRVDHRGRPGRRGAAGGARRRSRSRDRRRHPARRAPAGRGEGRRAGHHHHQPRRLQRARDAHRAPAQPRGLDRRRRARAGERRADAPVRCQLGDHLVRRGRPAARALVALADPRARSWRTC